MDGRAFTQRTCELRTCDLHLRGHKPHGYIINLHTYVFHVFISAQMMSVFVCLNVLHHKSGGMQLF